MNNNKINLFGASGHAKVIMDIMTSCNIKLGFLFDDDNSIVKFNGFNVTSDYKNEQINLYPTNISIGNNFSRKRIFESLPIINHRPLIHPSAVISPNASIADGTVVMPNATINSGAVIGRNCIINTSAVIEHDCSIEDYVHISPNAALAGGVRIMEGSHIGIGVSIIQLINVGRWAVIGAGSVIIKEAPDYSTIVGNPGKVIKIRQDMK